MTNEKKIKVKGILGTVLFHIGLICLLLFMALRFPISQPDSGGGGGGGITVNLGFDDTGMGSDQQDQPAPSGLLVQPEQSRHQQEPEEYLVQDDEEAAAIKAKKPEEIKKKPEKIIRKPKPETVSVKEVIKPVTEPVKEAVEPESQPEPKPQANPKAMYKGKNTTTTHGGQEGTTGQPGDQGQPDGVPGAPVYKGISGQGTGSGSGNGTGTGNGDGSGTGSGNGSGTGQGDGSGNGISYSLGGRGSLLLHKPSYDSKEQGKVVVTIKVDRNGNVTSAVAGAKGTNVSDQALWQLAKDAALKSRFATDPNAPDTQVGTITYNFIRQN
jgi:outer membrane biosynthesis protein TonB